MDYIGTKKFRFGAKYSIIITKYESIIIKTIQDTIKVKMITN